VRKTNSGEQEEIYREKKRICSEVSVNSPGNPWSQSRRRNGKLWWEGFAIKLTDKSG